MKKIFHFLRNLIVIGTSVLVFSSLSEYTAAASPNFNLPIARQAIDKKSRVIILARTNRPRSKVRIVNNIKDKSRWPKKSATVFINTKNDSDIYSAVLDAINTWNQTGAFNFKQVSNRKKAKIIINLMNDAGTNAAGETAVSYQPQKRRIVKANVYLNIFYLENPIYNYSYDRIVNTAEHELGHAMGLNHNKKISVMYPSGSYYSIQQRDVTAVKKLYHEK